MKCTYDLCNGTGFIPVMTETGEQEFKPCKCRLERSLHESLKKKRIEARIPVRYWDYSYDNYKKLAKMLEPKLLPQTLAENQKNLSILESYIESPEKLTAGPQVLWIWGTDDNACHTTLAIILSESILKANHKVLFLEFYKLMEMFTNFTSKSEYFQQLQGYDFYIIDDAFDTTRCKATDYRQAQLFGFMNDLFNDNKHIICTSNISAKNIDPIFSQLKIIINRSIEEIRIQGSFTPILQHL
jgi:chromosomal replication initiation ATPase DnaA